MARRMAARGELPLVKRAKANWEDFKKGKPGHRFQDRYERRRRATKGRFNWSRVVNIVLGLALLAVGLIMMPAPGPGAIIVLPGLALLGSEFLFLAKALDWAEPRVRAVISACLKIWKRMPVWARVLLVILGAAAGGAGAYFAWQWMTS